MPRFEHNLSKFIYILVNIFFLILAPFNLGYYGYNLIGEFIPQNKNTPLIAGTVIKRDNGVSDNNIGEENAIAEEVMIPDTSQIPTPSIDRVVPDPDTITEPTNSDYTGPITFFLCIDDPDGGADWVISVPDQPEVNVTYEDLERYGSGGLLIYCQNRIRLQDPSQEVIAIRNTEGESIERSISMLGAERYVYLILRYDQDIKQINYEISTERPR